ncbi:citramalate synthase [Candidatus Termititenax persephonae]|uniref:Citramalate synthase n=1 Tax=Candidatus Termititenax persephonae TaxID=2218525 RepID=A0A388TGM6_9BACT|nr:citramalate synthase [Candidatus Termititenax persephonae]
MLDSTLRDGEQGEGISFTVQDKLKITRLLDSLGIHYIEGGWPGSNPKTDEYFKLAKKEKLKHAKLVAFSSTCRAGRAAKDDSHLQNLLAAGTPAVTVFGKTWDLHVSAALKISLADNLKIIDDTIRFLKQHKKEVLFDAEHFFDAYQSNPEYALSVLLTAQDAGADRLVLCDTNGGTLPDKVQAIVSHVRAGIKTPLGIHTHNDAETAVASTLAAVAAGATQVQGTLNGYGERCGNANLCAIIPSLQLKMNYKILPPQKLAGLTALARRVAEIANLPPPSQAAYVGHSAFAHKAGVHVSAIQKNSATYEHVNPGLVGNKQRVLISELSGVSNLLYKAKTMRIDLAKDDPQTRQLVQKIKTLESAGYHFEEGEASLELLLQRTLGKHKPLFELISFHVTNEKFAEKELNVEATVKIKVRGKEIHTVADGNGPVSALGRALRKALTADYPRIKNIALSDYKVRVLDGRHGTEAKVRVIIESRDDCRTWGTVGVSTDVIEASWLALVDSIEYGLLK